MPQDKSPESTPNIDLLKDSEPPPAPAPKPTRSSSSKIKATTAPEKKAEVVLPPPPTLSERAMMVVKPMLPLDLGKDEYTTIFKDVLKSFDLREFAGAFVFWMLWKLGCRDRVLMCREEPQDFIKFVPDAAGPKIWKGGKPPFHRFAIGEAPKPGDILFLSNGPAETELLAVFLDVKEESKKMDNGMMSKPVWTIAKTIRNEKVFTVEAMDLELDNRVMDGRCVMGWLPLEALSYPGAK